MPPYCPERGDIIWVSFNPQVGHEQAGHRHFYAVFLKRRWKRAGTSADQRVDRPPLECPARRWSCGEAKPTGEGLGPLYSTQKDYCSLGSM